ncbi:Hypothetical protein A7982_06967 [Minicystis rosea]|nr:Hypothetical protein A7982_06967 [Minicystis rosea]
MDYRRAPSNPPLIVTLRERVMALDPDSSALRWEQRFPGGAGRLFLVGATLVVTGKTTSSARCFDLESGALRGHFDLGLVVETGLVRGDRLFLASSDAVVCITVGGSLIWGAWMENGALVFRNQAGDELWRMGAEAMNGLATSPLLLLGDLAAQPGS